MEEAFGGGAAHDSKTNFSVRARWRGTANENLTCDDFVWVLVDSKNQPSHITVVSQAQGPNMQARRSFVVTTLAIYESKRPGGVGGC